MRMITSFVASCLLLGIVSATSAQLVSSNSIYLIADGKTEFVGMELLSFDGQPVACYGLHKSPTEANSSGKSRFTYLILFKNGGTSPTVQGKGSAATQSGGRVNCDLKMTVKDDERTVQVDYKVEDAADGKMQETLTIGGKPQKADGPRIFLVDLSQPDSAIKSVNVVPKSESEFANRKERLQQYKRLIAELKKESAAVREFFKD